MAKFLIIFTALVALQICVQAAPSSADTESTNTENFEEEAAKLDSEQYEATQDTESTQRQKRFYNYFSFGLSPYDPFDTTFNFNKRDQSQDTGNYGTEDPLRQVYKRVQDILYYTRQQALSPPIPRFPVPTYVPIFYIPQAGCSCTADNEGPSNDQTPSNEPNAPDTSTPPTNTAQTTSSTNDNVPVTPTPTSATNNTSPDLVNRFDENDEDDGTRPISFDPIKPNRPLSRPPPPVEHGSVQGSGAAKGFETVTTAAPPFVAGVDAQPHLPTDSIPTLCDGAVLTCCHKPEVTYECFEQQGCPNASQYQEPCGTDTILSVIRKFQFYYANRIQG